MDFETYRVRMMADDPTILSMHDMGDGHCLIVARLLFHWTVRRSEIGNFDSYIERWCYAAPLLAEASIIEWRSRGFEGEPLGWHKHPDTGRVRPNGDPSKEHKERENPSWLLD